MKFRILFSFLIALQISSSVFSADEPAIKHVFLFIGDGMGDTQAEAAELAIEGSPELKLSFRKFPIIGWQKTGAIGGTTDSAAAATAIACGVKTKNKMLGLSPEGTELDSIAIIAKKAAWKIGILSSVSLDHATPAGFYARDNSRGNYSAISKTLADSNFDFFGGGGLAGQKGDDPKEDNLQRAIRNGFNIARTREDLAKIQKGTKVFAFNHRLTKEACLPYSIDYALDDIRLSEFTSAAIKHLSGNPFFIMVEGGKIDHACHGRDLGTMVREVLDFGAAVDEAVKFFNENPNDTIILVTADHETGDLVRLEPRSGNPSVALKQKISAEGFTSKIRKMKNEKSEFSSVLSEIKDVFALDPLTVEEEKSLEKAWKDSLEGKIDRDLYGKSDPTTSVSKKILSDRAGFQFKISNHSPKDVPVYAIGVGAEAFSGRYENTEIFFRLCRLMKLTVPEYGAKKNSQ